MLKAIPPLRLFYQKTITINKFVKFRNPVSIVAKKQEIGSEDEDFEILSPRLMKPLVSKKYFNKSFKTTKNPMFLISSKNSTQISNQSSMNLYSTQENNFDETKETSHVWSSKDRFNILNSTTKINNVQSI
mmetsp:Transcript_4086/g.3417  ORF Transcript_4086/g.3417 Transcript_4086/m.3417 type:complete len:131 (-) Transcript_4086:480-872(-)